MVVLISQRRLRELGDEGREEAELNGEDFINENEDGEGCKLVIIQIRQELNVFKGSCWL